jgi:translation initiation factor 4E
MAAAVSQVPVNENTKLTSPVDLSTIPISPTGGDKDMKPTGEKGEEQITVFHDKDNFNVKHPLMHKWTLWFTKPPSGKACCLQVSHSYAVLTMYPGRQLE